ncbi:uncharacterized protein LOC114942046 isoform X1 [Nylanderia fulva]|uniref:uncharacterized protein LOC114942046 isoform X1 n=1 Tax=Nylanderia fulva TaxID=613905 RepID=UPI0010FB11AA|nr:uncharacterized protein LOC114942046 isoform X1 [Nylanderia fulva]XP_029173154.1 uncharacterized protein LOC114942046 isoform X1 [Nylanderia fulva]
MATIEDLPNEIIIIILSYSDITIEDVINFRCICKRFQCAAKNNKFKELKLLQRWSSVKKFYDTQSNENEQKESEENEGKDKKKLNFIEIGVNCMKELHNFIFQIIVKYYCDSDQYDLIDYAERFEYIFRKHFQDEFEKIINKPENIIKYYFFIDELKRMITQSSGINNDQNEKMIKMELFRYMRRSFLKETSKRFDAKLCENQLLEEAVTIEIQIAHPEKIVFYSCVQASLDDITQKVRNRLREKHPNHLIFSITDETFSYWKNNTEMRDSFYNKEEELQIWDALADIFDKLNFQLCKSEDKNVENLCIDDVLKNKYGQHVILLIIYHSVARRLGLKTIIKPQGRYQFSMFWIPKTALRTGNLTYYEISFEQFPKFLPSKTRTPVQHYGRQTLGSMLETIKLMYCLRECFSSSTKTY